MLFWTTADLEIKLLEFRTYFNNHRTHNSLERRTRIRWCQDQSPISSRFDGNRAVDPYIRHQWLRDSEGLGLAAVSGRPRQNSQEIIGYSQRASRIRLSHCNRMCSDCERQLTFKALLPVRSATVTIRQR